MHGHGPRRWDHTLDVTSSTSTICHLTLSRPITLDVCRQQPPLPIHRQPLHNPLPFSVQITIQSHFIGGTKSL
ncbi:hypothetical protein CGRA01v4_08039 [Colletotrichum graminicola]|nr:hypothetical protein CGRA01v4_08039 [Colletotrichum graminicola]